MAYIAFGTYLGTNIPPCESYMVSLFSSFFDSKQSMKKIIVFGNLTQKKALTLTQMHILDWGGKQIN